jgi:stringent starvation protein B
MTSNRPYLIRAMYQWILDNDWTPHIQVDVNFPGVEVPTEYAQEGVIVLNLNPTAVFDLDLTNDWISFRARFQGVERKVAVPPSAVLAVFARENGQGMPFPPEPYPEESFTSNPKDVKQGLSSLEGGKASKKPTKTKSSKKPTLKVIK